MDRQLRFLSAAYLTLGKLKMANELSSLTEGAEFEQAALALVWADAERLKPYPPGWTTTLSWLVILQLDSGAVQQIGRLPSPPDLPPGQGELLAAELAMARGDCEAAIPEFREGIQTLKRTALWPIRYLLLGSIGLAKAWNAQGNVNEAIRVLEEASTWRKKTYPESGALWLEVRARLAQLYRRTGRVREAQKVEEQLRQLLSYGDPDHPILVQLNAVAGSS